MDFDLIKFLDSNRVDRLKELNAENIDKIITPNSNDDNKILDYLLKGSAIGLGGALTLGLFKALGGKKDINASDEDDDNVMYLKKKATIEEDFDQGIGIAGGIGGSVLAYFLGNKIINYIRDKQAQKALDEAQRQAYHAQGYDVINVKKLKKKANSDSDKGLLGTLVTGGSALGALLFLSGGIGTYAYLNSKYPVNKNDFKVKNPTTIKIIKDDGIKYINNDDEDRELIDRISKQASHMEIPAFLLSGIYKEASQVSDVVSTVAQGNLDSFKKAVDDVGFFNALDLIKGASSQPADEVNKALSVIYCTKEASFKDQFNLLTAAEFGYFNQEMLRTINTMDKCLAKQACDLCDIVRSGLYLSTIQDLGMCKSANSVESINKNVVLINNELEDLITKRANNFLITNQNDTKSTELSNGGVTPASKVNGEALDQQQQKYTDSMDASDKKVSEDVIDDTLQTDCEDLTCTADLKDLFE